MDRAMSNKHRAPHLASRGMGPCVRRDDSESVEGPYASPSVSNIAALIASAVDLPAHTTNWKAGK